MAKIQLYEKSMQGNRVRYLPWNERYRTELHLEDAELCTILSGLVVGFLIQMQEHYPDHSRLARELEKTMAAVVSLAKTAGTVSEPSEKMLTVATMAWNAAVKAMEDGLLKGEVEA